MIRPPFQVVIIDDVCRFAYHAYQYLSQSVSFGIGTLAYDKDSTLSGNGEKRLTTPAGDIELSWINAGLDDWDAFVREAARRIAANQLHSCFLVDVRGSSQADQIGYSVLDVERTIKEELGVDPVLFPVSSYRTGRVILGDSSYRQIYPKTLRVLKEVSIEAAASFQQEAKVLPGRQVLVTGAGFELAATEPGAASLGMKPTATLLEQTWARLHQSVKRAGVRRGYPVPIFEKKHRASQVEAEENLERASKKKTLSLDEYWNEALGIVLQAERDRSLGKGRNFQEAKVDASQSEHRVREVFRSVFQRYDWGHINQALDAASLEWTAWLTTNYTGFADRAISLWNGGSGGNKWQIISTANEARFMNRRLLHGEISDPVLFKLHGHIEHILTMAIAGQDKEIYSTLSLPVDSLHDVYVCAEKFLQLRLGEGSGTTYWHIVGHGLEDQVLNALLKKAFTMTGEHGHFCICVGLDPDESYRVKAKKFIESKHIELATLKLKARDYMARLKRFGLPPKDKTLFHDWLDQVRSADSPTATQGLSSPLVHA